MKKKYLGWAIIAVGAIIVYSWLQKRKGTVAPPAAVNVTATGGTAAGPTLAQTGMADIFIGGLPGIAGLT